MRQLGIVERYVCANVLHLDPAAWKRGGGALDSFEPVGSLTRGMDGGREGGKVLQRKRIKSGLKNGPPNQLKVMDRGKSFFHLFGK